MKLLISIFVLISSIACSSEKEEASATIIERKVIDEKYILITYSFRAGDKTIIDSVRTENKVISDDSLMVNYSRSDPGNNTLMFR